MDWINRINQRCLGHWFKWVLFPTESWPRLTNRQRKEEEQSHKLIQIICLVHVDNSLLADERMNTNPAYDGWGQLHLRSDLVRVSIADTTVSLNCYWTFWTSQTGSSFEFADSPGKSLRRIEILSFSLNRLWNLSSVSFFSFFSFSFFFFFFLTFFFLCF